ASHFIDYQLIGDQISTPEMRAVFDERAMLQRWLDVEAALAAAQEELGLIPTGSAAAIARVAKVEALDLETVRRDLAVTAHPIVPIVRELARLAGEAGRWVHWGATTRDVMDTGRVLQLRAAHTILRRDLVALVLALADLAESHRDTVMAGRTHAQQALPITFGFKVATWTAECVRQVERLDDGAPRLFVGELGGAVGTLAGFGPQGEAVQRSALERLGLGVSPIAWHASRDTIGGLLRGLAATAVETMVAAHERDMSVGRAEWVLVPEAACLAAATEHWSLVVARGLRVNVGRMKENLGRLGGLLLSEPVMLKLG